MSAISPTTPLTELADLYRAYLRDSTAKTTKTRKTYGYQASSLNRFLQETAGPAVDSSAITHASIFAYRKHLEQCQSRPRTVRAMLLGVRSFCRWLVLIEVLAADPSLAVPFPVLDLAVRRVPKKEEVDKLLAGAEKLFPKRRSIMARAMFHLLIYAGLRRTELLTLRPGDIDHGEGCVNVWAGKGGKGRRVFLPANALAVLAEWEAERGQCRHDRLFDYDGNRYIAATGWLTLLREVRYQGGLQDATWLTAHCLRHYFATTLIRCGVDIEIVRAQLGHSEIATTARYLHSDSVTLRNAAQLLDPASMATGAKPPDRSIAAELRAAHVAAGLKRPNRTTTVSSNWLD